jgi:hypothetical protein
MKAASILVIVVAAALAASPLLRSGPQDTGTLENIDGIPYPERDGVVTVTEKLAHADIYLKEPALAKDLVLSVTFTPYDTTRLEVGIRENSFWLSYPRQVIYQAKDTPRQDEPESITHTVTIPLTDKLTDSDGSVDLMFFAENKHSTRSEDEGIDDATLWRLDDMAATTVLAKPSPAALKDYVRSILTREKPL